MKTKRQTEIKKNSHLDVDLLGIYHKISRSKSLRVRVYVVLEHAKGRKDAIVHGVYSSRFIADCKAKSIQDDDPKHGYTCVLQKTVEGPELDIVNCERLK